MSSTKTSKEILSDALKLLKTAGWIKGDLGSSYSGYCAVGALRKAAFGNVYTLSSTSLNYNAYRNALFILADNISEGSIPAWNDRLYRTKEDVVNVFRQAIIKASRNVQCV